MKKQRNMTKRKLTRLLRHRCPESMNEETRSVIELRFKQLKRTNRFKIEVFESEPTDDSGNIYDFIVSKDGLPLIRDIRKALNNKTIATTPLFVTAAKFDTGIPFVVMVNSKHPKVLALKEAERVRSLENIRALVAHFDSLRTVIINPPDQPFNQ